MIIIIFSLILLLLAYFLYVQKKKVISLQQRISDLQSKTSIKDKQSQIIRSSEHILELLNNEKV